MNVVGNGQLTDDGGRREADDLHRDRSAVAEVAEVMAERAVLGRRNCRRREALVVIGVMVNERDRVIVAIVGRVPSAHGPDQGQQDG